MLFRSAILFFDRGLAKEKKWDLDEAMVDYNQAISQFSQLQALNLSSNQPSPLPEAIKLNPNFALAYNNRGNVKSKKGDLDGAMADYNQAIELNPNLPTPMNTAQLSRRGRAIWMEQWPTIIRRSSWIRNLGWHTETGVMPSEGKATSTEPSLISIEPWSSESISIIE